ncbi:MAG: hypothetical protein QF473_40980, partial [Planctomycetota bacterium]|nr:hypothetical protein [Planctomycetota bacterium]
LVFNPDEFAGDHIGTVMGKAKRIVNSDLVKPYPGDEKSRMTWYSMGSASPRWVRRNFGGLSWSADGKRLVFSSNMDDGYFYVYILSLEGGEPRRLDQTKSAWLQEISWCQE